jgi:uncharacterized iron-regulated protein
MVLRQFFLEPTESSALETKPLEILSLELVNQATQERLNTFLRAKSKTIVNLINKLVFTKTIWTTEKADVFSEETVDQQTLELISATSRKSRRKCVHHLLLLESPTLSTSFSI